MLRKPTKGRVRVSEGTGSRATKLRGIALGIPQMDDKLLCP